MARRQQLTEVQISELFDPPSDQRELVRHYTLSDTDLAAIQRCRGDHNRLGHALMLCYLRYPGRPLRAGEKPQGSLLAFIADQIDVLPESVDEYLLAERSRRSHAAELQNRLQLRPFGTRPAAELTAWLLPHAIEDERLGHLARLIVEECRQRRILLPWPAALERLCIEVRHQARRGVQRRLTNGLTADPSAYPTLEPMIAGRINVDLIRAHWSEILRVVASILTGTVTASLIMRQLASYPRQNGVAAALRELGRLERTLFTLDWISDPELRRTTGQELNKGESRNSLARAVFIHRLGEIRDRTYENQQHRASGLNLLVTAIILWNTRYLERAVKILRTVEDVPDQLLAHLSPLGWEHVNLTGDYVWGNQDGAPENTVGLRPLRATPELTRQAA